MPVKLALTNATGRQSAALARTASAVGYTVSAHIVSTKYSPLVASEIAELPHTEVHYGPLSSAGVREALFEGADIAFINTTSFDAELEVGKRCAEAAQAAGVKHIIYSSMPDHSEAGLGQDWHGLPQYKPKWQVEKYIRALQTPATFVYTGIYHNNFTSLPYPLFCLREVPWEEVERWDGDWTSHWLDEKDGEETKGRKCGFEWQAPFGPNMNRPWVDIEHDFGPAVLQVFKDGPKKWNGRRVPIAFDILSPQAVCAALSRGLNRPVRYVQGPIEISVPIPKGYNEQLQALQELFGGEAVGGKNAPYWWDGIFNVEGNSEPKYPHELRDSDEDDVFRNVRTARMLWGGWRDIEGYARDVFPVEERLNGKDWMD